MLPFFLLLLLKASIHTDIYDILSKKPSSDFTNRTQNKSQYIIGIYKEKPDHARTDGMNVVVMKSSFGTEFTCLIPLTESVEEKKEEADETTESSNAEGNQPAADEKEPPIETSPS